MLNIGKYVILIFFWSKNWSIIQNFHSIKNLSSKHRDFNFISRSFLWNESFYKKLLQNRKFKFSGKEKIPSLLLSFIQFHPTFFQLVGLLDATKKRQIIIRKRFDIVVVKETRVVPNEGRHDTAFFGGRRRNLRGRCKLSH